MRSSTSPPSCAAIARPAGTFGFARWPHWVQAALLALVLAAAAPVRADEYNEVNRLSRSGDLAKALARADEHLASKPRDPQMRFLRAVILSEAGRKEEAEQALVALTQDYPELPEPYNNLAVLLAARGELDRARAALEMATATDTTYATAHENLGDVLAQLAARSYRRALQLEPGRNRIQPKLQLLRQLANTSANAD